MTELMVFLLFICFLFIGHLQKSKDMGVAANQSLDKTLSGERAAHGETRKRLENLQGELDKTKKHLTDMKQAREKAEGEADHFRGMAAQFREARISAERNLAKTSERMVMLEDELLRLRTGEGPPSCLYTNGKLQTLLKLRVTEQAIEVRPVWPSTFEDEVRQVPALADLVRERKLSDEEFKSRAIRIYRYSDNSKNVFKRSCRFYVAIDCEFSQGMSSDRYIRAENIIDDYFFISNSGDRSRIVNQLTSGKSTSSDTPRSVTSN